MGRKLSELSLEELWQLFPIFLMEHQPCWKEWYQEEVILLQNALPQTKRISHIGSTAVSSIWAKAIVDILVEVPEGKSLTDYKDIIISNGYVCMSESREWISFNKGYTEAGFAERVFHLHLRHCGNNDELYFRDYLIDHPDAAKEYEELKLKLWKKYEHNRDAYTNAKTDFIKKYTQLAKNMYKDRY